MRLPEYTEAKGILTSEAGVARLHNAQTKPGAEAESLEFLDINRFCQPFRSEQAESTLFPRSRNFPQFLVSFPM